MLLEAVAVSVSLQDLKQNASNHYGTLDAEYMTAWDWELALSQFFVFFPGRCKI
jgi:hypothetical protein